MEEQPRRRSCGAQVEHRRLLNEDLSYVAARSEIENLSRAYRLGAEATSRVGIARIPVAVHVVFNTPAQNISDAQIGSQIDVLNQDFRRRNPDVAQVPQVWQPVAADAQIEFFLATTDPSGNPTTGITRTQTQITSFPMQGNPVKSAATGGANPWPADRYLNMWVCQLSGGLLGYAQFPGGPPETDGVVIRHSACGTSGTAAPPFDRGRTATHEIGHYLNLFHIWGDDGTGCNGTDEVVDTPNQGGPNTGRPAFPRVSCSNGPNGDMFMNYMDYTDDAGMFMFTTGQKARMDAALDGPRSPLLGTASSLHLSGVTWDGRLWHTIRRPDGSWQQFGDVEGQAGDRGAIRDVDIAVVATELHLCGVSGTGRLWHTIRFLAGNWQTFGDVEGQAGDRGAFVRVGIAGLGGDLHVCGVTGDGRLWHAVRRANGSWTPFGDVEGQAGNRGSFVDVDCAGVNGLLHVAGTTSDGRLWHTIRSANGSWQQFGDVEGQTGDRGSIKDVATAVTGNELHVCAVSTLGRLWHAVRRANGSWTPFGDVEGQAGDRGSFARVSAGEVGGELHLAGTTSNGRLWHTIRFANGSWQQFGDVEGQAGDRGSLRTVSVDG